MRAAGIAAIVRPVVIRADVLALGPKARAAQVVRRAPVVLGPVAIALAPVAHNKAAATSRNNAPRDLSPFRFLTWTCSSGQRKPAWIRWRDRLR